MQYSRPSPRTPTLGTATSNPSPEPASSSPPHQTSSYLPAPGTSSPRHPAGTPRYIAPRPPWGHPHTAVHTLHTAQSPSLDISADLANPRTTCYPADRTLPVPHIRPPGTSSSPSSTPPHRSEAVDKLPAPLRSAAC